MLRYASNARFIAPNALTIDVVYIPNSLAGKKFLVVARDYLSGYIEAKALLENSFS
jgi:hypothetical protein